MTRKITTLDLDYLVREYRSGRSAHDIAREMGVSSHVLYDRLAELGVEKRVGKYVPQFHIPFSEIKAKFDAGRGLTVIAKDFGVSAMVISRIMRENGLKARNQAETQQVRMTNATPEERKRLAKAAHDAVRGKLHGDEHRAKIALTREARQTSVSAYERNLAAVLRQKGLDPVLQKAFGRYNCDIAVAPVAVEIFGGGWHWSGEHFDRAERRLRYILDAGWHVLMIQIDRRHAALMRAVADYVVAYVQEVSSDPTRVREYRVVRGAGELLTAGRADDDELSIVPAFTSARDPVTGRYKGVPR